MVSGEWEIMTTKSNINNLVNRMQKRVAALAPDNPELKKAFIGVGLLVSAEAKLNVRRHRMIDTGRLINSLRHEFFREGTTSGVRVGSFGVPYAANHEFGFKGIVSVKGHNVRAYMRETNVRTQIVVKESAKAKAHTRSILKKTKVEVKEHTVRGHERLMKVEARPYLRPAVEKHGTFIIDTLRQALQLQQKGSV